MVVVAVAFCLWWKVAGNMRERVMVAGVPRPGRTQVQLGSVSAFTAGGTSILCLAVVNLMSNCLFVADRYRCRHSELALNDRYAALAVHVTGASVALGLLIVYAAVCGPCWHWHDDLHAGFTHSHAKQFNYALVFLCATDLHLLELLPWRDTTYDGLPTKGLFLLRFFTLCADVAHVTIQLMFLGDGGSVDGWKTQVAIVSGVLSVLKGLHCLFVRSCWGAAPHDPGRTPSAGTVARQATWPRCQDFIPDV